MTPFMITAALLTALALLFILPPLLRRESPARAGLARADVNLAVLRDQLRELDVDLERGAIDADGHQVARGELERRVAEDVQPVAAAPATPDQRWTAAALALTVTTLAVSLYLLVGTPAGLDPILTKPQDPGHALTEEQIAGMVGTLAARLKAKPDDAEGWSMLARSYNALSRFPESVEAYTHLVKLIPNDADVLADYADTLAMASNKSLQGEPERLVSQALAIDPRNVKALALAGSAAFERRDYRQAVVQWQKVMGLVPADSDMARSSAAGISEAQSLAGDPLAAPAAQAAPAAPAAAAPTASQVAGSVELDPALRARVGDGDSVFIFARAVNGPRFPLAVLRKQVRDLPLRFVLDDSMSMVAGANLSSAKLVVVGARISKSGSATPAAGDFEGLSAQVRPGATGLKIVIGTSH
ncbi:MAG: c-type cytochrome biogenesis protein CcmI [Pseudomonadota bacterium]